MEGVEPAGPAGGRLHRFAAVICGLAFEAFFFYLEFTVILPTTIICLDPLVQDRGRERETYLDMMRSSWSFHDGFGSALRNVSTVLKSVNSTKTEL